MYKFFLQDDFYVNKQFKQYETDYIRIIYNTIFDNK